MGSDQRQVSPGDFNRRSPSGGRVFTSDIVENCRRNFESFGLIFDRSGTLAVTRTVTMWPDNETSTDLIGFQVHADLLRDVIVNPAMLPITIGVFGDWGGGKTSIMKMLERALDPDTWPAGSPERSLCDGIAVVYVNTWQFEGYDDAKSAILSSVLMQLKEHKRFGKKVQAGALNLLKAVNWGRFIRLSLKHVAVPAAAAFMTGGAAAIPAGVAASIGLTSLLSQGGVAATDKEGLKEAEVAELWKGIPEEHGLDVKTFRDQFSKLLDSGTIKTLVVLIDDLDRCTPERIVENLEAVKLFLSVERSAFVIGADRRIVEHAIRSRYALRATDDTDRQTADRLVRDYLEKVVQVPYTLPRLSASEIETYMALLFCQHHLDTGDAALCIAASEKARTANRYGTFGYGGIKAALEREPKDELVAALTLSKAAAPLIADGLKGNPRQVKRFLNALLLRRQLARVAGLTDAVRTDVLVKLMVLEYVEPDRFTELFNDLGQSDGRVPMLGRFEGGASPGEKTSSEDRVSPAWTTPWVKRWIAMPPLLADIDLRDYFWVARDRLESTFAGVTMVPPIVRTVLEGLVSGLAPKRNAAVQTAKNLKSEELAALYRLIEQRISSKPDESGSWEALRVLADALVDGAAESLASALISQPPNSIPPQFGLSVVNLHNDRPNLRSILRPAIDRLGATATKVGKAIKGATLKA